MSLEKQGFKTIITDKLNLEIFHASEKSYGVASVIITGKQEAVLVDAQFTLLEAEKVAQVIKHSKKTLTTIYISHGDPDFYFGLEVFKKYFPEVVAYASPATVEHIAATAQTKLDGYGDELSQKITTNVVLPQVLKESVIEVDGEKIEIIGLNSFPKRTFLWIPSIKAVLGGIIVFGTTFHVWMADTQTAESRNDWITILNKIIDLKPEIVIPAHAKSGADVSMAPVNHTKNYVQFYEEALKANTSSKGLIAALKSKYPDLGFEEALELGAKVNTGEIKW